MNATLDMPKFRVTSAPSIRKTPNSLMRSDFDKVRKIQAEFLSMFQANVHEFDQIVNMWKMYFAAIGEQWDPKAVKYKQSKGLRSAQYNIIGPKVDVFLGMLMSDEYDFRFDPIDAERNSGVEALETAYYCDKELCNYDNHYMQVLKDGIIHLGCMEVVISTEYDPRGNIAFKRCLPGRWVFDRNWISDDDRDCAIGCKHSSMTLREMISKWPNLLDKSSPQIEKELQLLEQSGMSWVNRNLDEITNPEPYFEHTYHVIEHHQINEIKKSRIVAMDKRGRWIPFPVTEDENILEEFAVKNGVTNWSDAKRVPYMDKIDECTVICPQLMPADVIEQGKPEIQIKSLPVIQFTTNRDISGRNKGIVNDLVDIQLDVNYSRAKRQELLANAQGGAGVFDKNAFPNISDRDDFEKNANDPTRMFGVDGSPERFFKRLNDHSANSELIRLSGAESFDAVDRISGVSSAMSAQTQGASEPASLYEMKLKVNKIGQLSVDKRVQRVRERMAEAYFLQAQISYRGSERTFTSRDGKKKAVMNENLNTGVIRNKIDEVPRCSVTITESAGNMSLNMRNRSEMSAILQTLPKEYAEPIAIAVGQLLKTTGLSEDKKERLEEAIQIECVKARMNSISQMAATMANTQNSKLQTLQLQQQFTALMAQLNGAGNEQQVPSMESPEEQQDSGADASTGMGQEKAPDMLSAAPGNQQQPSIEQQPPSQEGL